MASAPNRRRVEGRSEASSEGEHWSAPCAQDHGVRWREPEEGLEERIGKLWDAVQSGRYRTLPSRKVYIPKADGKQRPPSHRGAGGQNRSAGRGGGAHADPTR
jgi:hypothetical protein